MSELHPTIAIESAFMGGCKFLVTKVRTEYVKAVKQGQIAFSWPEILKIVEADPTAADIEWCLRIKKMQPGTRIDDIRTRKVTTPGA